MALSLLDLYSRSGWQGVQGTPKTIDPPLRSVLSRKPHPPMPEGAENGLTKRAKPFGRSVEPWFSARSGTGMPTRQTLWHESRRAGQSKIPAELDRASPGSAHWYGSRGFPCRLAGLRCYVGAVR
jgi:hypothetical protein